jgi:hypothetical protein
VRHNHEVEFGRIHNNTDILVADWNVEELDRPFVFTSEVGDDGWDLE